MVERLQGWGSRAVLIMPMLLLYLSVVGNSVEFKAERKTLSAPIQIAVKQEWTIHYEPEEPYTLAKLEPESGVYLGAYVLQDDTIGQSMDRFNELMGKQHASYFRYVGYGQPFPQQWAEQVKEAGAFPHIAWEPNNGLDEVEANDYAKEFADAAHELGIPIFLRFASEMNGTWTNYSGNPSLYKQKWQLVHRIFQERAPNVAMVWTVLAMPENTIESFYPGDEYVDWVGVNVYNVRYHNGSLKQKAEHEDPLDLISHVYNRFSRTKPIQLSEFGVTHYSTTDNRSSIDYAEEKLTRLYANLDTVYPRVKAVYYFDVNNVTAYNESRRINDYSLTNEERLIRRYSELISGPSYLSQIPDSMKAGESVPQSFTHYGRVFQEDGILYADESFFTEVMGLSVAMNKQAQGESSAIIRLGNEKKAPALQVPVLKRYMWTGINASSGLPINRMLYGLPIREISTFFGYTVKVDGTSIYIQE